MASEGQDRAHALGWGIGVTSTDLRPSPTTPPRKPTIPQKVTNVSNYRKGAEYYVVLFRILQMNFGEFSFRILLPRLYEKVSSADKAPRHEANHGSIYQRASPLAHNLS